MGEDVMNSGIIEVGPQHQEGAKINLSIDLGAGDCFVMCRQLFSRLKDYEKKEIVDEYMKDSALNYCGCSGGCASK